MSESNIYMHFRPLPIQKVQKETDIPAALFFGRTQFTPCHD